MYIIKNALQNLLRNKGRNILVAIIVLAIIATTVVALIINNTASAVLTDRKNQLDSEVYIEDARMSAGTGSPFDRPEPLTAEQYLAFSQSEYLARSLAFANVRCNGDDSFNALDQDVEPDRPGGGGTFFVSIGGANGDFTLNGGNWQDFDSTNSGSGKNYRLLDDGVSRMPYEDTADGKAQNECILNQYLAAENNIKVNDRIHFEVSMIISMNALPEDTLAELEAMDEAGELDDLSDWEEDYIITVNGLEYTLTQNMRMGMAVGPNGQAPEIPFDMRYSLSRKVVLEMMVVGLYDDGYDAAGNLLDADGEIVEEDALYDGRPVMAAFNPRNTVYTTLYSLLNLREKDETSVNVSATYYLQDPAMLADFEAELRGKGLSSAWSVSTNATAYENQVRPVVQMQEFTMLIMWVVIGLGAVILFLLSYITIRERKYEIGVLRAMGMKKSRVALGLWTEILVITGICLVIGIGAGVLAAQPVSDRYLSSQGSSQDDGTTNGNSVYMGRPNGGGQGAPVRIQGGTRVGGMLNSREYKPLSEMDVTVGADTLMQILAIAVLLASASALISISQITKYEPIKILMERN
ncbi:MAG: ABC transporter permease [Oscillospiraceae bacterium]|nr:ABC transporter permease [Oscillospiraceae bacterium]